MPDPDNDTESEFDAVAAARELEEALGEGAPAARSGEEGERYVSILEGEIEQLNAMLAQKEELLRRADQRADQAYREIEAAGRRLAVESARELEQRTRKLLGGFLGVVDDLDRAIASTKAVEHNPEVLAGIELVRRELLAHLGQLGVAPVPALGERFDPERHEAMTLVPVSDPAQDGRVVGVMREAYSIGEDMLRPAGVAVGKLR
jgi:molecular chaperone GrpE